MSAKCININENKPPKTTLYSTHTLQNYSSLAKQNYIHFILWRCDSMNTHAITSPMNNTTTQSYQLCPLSHSNLLAWSEGLEWCHAVGDKHFFFFLRPLHTSVQSHPVRPRDKPDQCHPSALTIKASYISPTQRKWSHQDLHAIQTLRHHSLPSVVVASIILVR